jgi:hypothetical protein
MKETERAISRGTRSGVPRHQSERSTLDKEESEGYDWGVDLAGTIKLGGLKFVLGNRAALKVRSPLRFS